MTRMIKNFSQIACLLLTTFVVFADISAQEPTDTSMQKIGGFLKASGYTYTTHTNGTLVVDTSKDKLLIVSKGGFLIISFSRILPKAYVPRTDAVLFSLMRLNDTLNFSKVGIDRDGDLFLRVETRADLMDKFELDRTVKQLIADYDKVKSAVFSPAPAEK